MKIQVAWELEVPDESVPKLVEEAVSRGCGSTEDFGSRELIARLMMDGGEDVVQETLQDPARTKAVRLSC